MVKQQRIQVVVDEQGGVNLDYSHFTGATCLAVGKQLHALLSTYGIQTVSSTITPKPELAAAQLVHQPVHTLLEVEE
jgi:hypothetical protein